MRNQGFYNRPPDGSRRGQHPDISDDGNLRPEAIQYPDPTERDFNARWANDPNFAAHLMDRVTVNQALLPEYVQQQVAGQVFGAGKGTFAGIREYAQELDRLRAEEDRYKYGADVTVVRDFEIADMSLADYDRHFDERGQPRSGVVVEHTERSVRLDDGIDSASRGELRGRSR